MDKTVSVRCIKGGDIVIYRIAEKRDFKDLAMMRWDFTLDGRNIDEMVKLMHDFMYNRWQKLDVITEVSTEGIIDINGKEFGIIRYLNVEGELHRMMVVHSEIGGHMFAIKFKYPESEKDWSEVEDFVNTIEVLY